MRVVVAPDKFKGCLSALEVARAVATGLQSARPDAVTVVLPVADGGDGTVAAALAAGYGKVVVAVEGPTGRRVQAPYAVRGREAVVELAAACGLDLLPEGRREPLLSSTYGLGQVIADAVSRGATRVVLGLGGSASTDGGAGMVQALGARLLDRDGGDLGRGGGALTDLATLDLAGLPGLAGAQVVVAGDVDNPLLGTRGAATVFGPQKGALPPQVQHLEAGLAHWADLVERATGSDRRDERGAGAAGGAGFAALALLDATPRPGIEMVLALVDFDTAVAGADLVVTGEGSLDEQSLAGKAPVGVARAAARAGVKVVAVAGRNLLSDDQLRRAGISAAYSLDTLEPDLARSMERAPDLLRQVGRTIADHWLAGPPPTT